MSDSDTIFALATPAGKSGVAVTRVSGPQAFSCLNILTRKEVKLRTASLRKLYDLNGKFLDEAIVISFNENASFTGEDIVEFQTHGSMATIKALNVALSKIEGYREALPGEFTRRAFTNGCMDLMQVEGLSYLLNAETEIQREKALNMFQGKFSSYVEGWRIDLIKAMSLIEVSIDFSDEDIPESILLQAVDLISKIINLLSFEINGLKINERLFEGFEVAIIGRPNVGKSTLLNCLSKKDAAITSSIAGTTRDVVEVAMDIKGIPVTFLDTAGIHNSNDEIENLGIEKAKKRAFKADIRLFLLEDINQEVGIEKHSGDIIRIAKGDINVNKNSVSGKNGLGVEELVEEIYLTLIDRISISKFATGRRQEASLVRTRDILKKAVFFLSAKSNNIDLAAEELRFAITSLDELIGKVDVENVLDQLFSTFCLGK